MDPDVLLRHRPIIERIRSQGRILEIGRGEIDLVHLLNSPMGPCDVIVPRQRASAEDSVLATGARLPFAARAFEAAVAVDASDDLTADFGWISSGSGRLFQSAKGGGP